jgi:hypothetical protein
MQAHRTNRSLEFIECIFEAQRNIISTLDVLSCSARLKVLIVKFTKTPPVFLAVSKLVPILERLQPTLEVLEFDTKLKKVRLIVLWVC